MAETDDRIAFEGIRSATVLKPGDRVLIELGDCTPVEMAGVADAFKGRFPDVSFTLISGVNSIVVEAADRG